MVDLPERLMVRVQSDNERTYYSKYIIPELPGCKGTQAIVANCNGLHCKPTTVHRWMN